MKLIPLSSEKVIKTLEIFGFQVVRQKGSHIILKHADGMSTVVPYREEIGRGLLRSIIREAKIDREEFLKAVEG
ncbi:MAG: type II toxin-antitoxin system HicA family toxin [Candidatus Aenigmarchaeota archaeon]|nr:type II toxin-antitoxin system HicA family toxin [Candidatus Aenigmarchaeota archaeon]